jgi:hypothetical protein
MRRLLFFLLLFISFSYGDCSTPNGVVIPNTETGWSDWSDTGNACPYSGDQFSCGTGGAGENRVSFSQTENSCQDMSRYGGNGAWYRRTSTAQYCINNTIYNSDTNVCEPCSEEDEDPTSFPDLPEGEFWVLLQDATESCNPDSPDSPPSDWASFPEDKRFMQTAKVNCCDITKYYASSGALPDDEYCNEGYGATHNIGLNTEAQTCEDSCTLAGDCLDSYELQNYPEHRVCCTKFEESDSNDTEPVDNNESDSGDDGSGTGGGGDSGDDSSGTGGDGDSGGGSVNPYNTNENPDSTCTDAQAQECLTIAMYQPEFVFNYQTCSCDSMSDNEWFPDYNSGSSIDDDSSDDSLSSDDNSTVGTETNTILNSIESEIGNQGDAINEKLDIANSILGGIRSDIQTASNTAHADSQGIKNSIDAANVHLDDIKGNTERSANVLEEWESEGDLASQDKDVAMDSLDNTLADVNNKYSSVLTSFSSIMASYTNAPPIFHGSGDHTFSVSVWGKSITFDFSLVSNLRQYFDIIFTLMIAYFTFVIYRWIFEFLIKIGA